MELTLKVNGDASKEPYVIESKNHSRMVFGKAGHLIHIIDQNGNQITVTFGKDDGKIIAVTGRCRPRRKVGILYRCGWEENAGEDADCTRMAGYGALRIRTEN